MFKFKQKDSEDEEEDKTQKSKYFICGSILNDKQTDDTEKQWIASTLPSTSSLVSSEKTITSVDEPNERSTDETRKAVLFGNTLLVNSNQSANKLLKHLRIAYQMTDSISPAHYLMFDSCCALFLSLKYHVIYPNYIYEKLNQLRNSYQLKVLLVLVDQIEFQNTLKELTKLAIRTNWTLMLAWSYEEAANHIENYRNYADKSADIIMGKQSVNSEANQTAHQCLVEALTSVKSINKTDAISLISTFDSFENIIKSDDDQLIICPGMAALKAQRLRQFFHKSFIRNNN